MSIILTTSQKTFIKCLLCVKQKKSQAYFKYIFFTFLNLFSKSLISDVLGSPIWKEFFVLQMRITCISILETVGFREEYHIYFSKIYIFFNL